VEDVSERVWVSFATFAEHANYSEAGRINILGAFDAVPTDTVPVQIPRVVFTFRLQIRNRAAGSLHLRFTLSNPSGETVLHAEQDLAHELIEPGTVFHADNIIPLTSLRLETAGPHTVLLTADEQPIYNGILEVVAEAF